MEAEFAAERNARAEPGNTAGAPGPALLPRHPPGRVRGVLRRPIIALDKTLRRQAGIVEFTDREDCILRMGIIPAPHPMTLSDGTELGPGDRIIDLHLWNEHIPDVEPDGPSLRWGRWMGRAFARSLGMLAQHLATRPDLADIKVIRARMNFGSPARSRELGPFAEGFGFEQVPDPQGQRPLARLHLLGENILLLLLAFAYNVHTFRWRTLLRGRSDTYVSRAGLDRRYGGQRKADGR